MTAPCVSGLGYHTGWAEVVTVAAREGAPSVVDRRRVELLDADLPSQPHHHESGELSLPEAEQLIAKVKASVAAHSRATLAQLQADLSPDRLVAITLREGSPEIVPDALAEIMQSHAALMVADSEMYRTALCAAATELGLEVILHPRGSESERVADALGCDTDEVGTRLRELGRAIGTPWRKEHRAAAAAISVLRTHTTLA